MGFLAQTITSLLPQLKDAVGSTVPLWDQGRPQTPQWDYERGARDGYMLSDLVYACIEQRCTSIGEPPICAYRMTSGAEEKIEEDHPALDLLNQPNPFMGRARFWGTLLMHMDIGGNAYVEKVRSGAGKVVELWLLRPDRMRVIPGGSYISGYRYQVGSDITILPAEDVIHFRNRHPLDDYYGLAPLAAVAGRVDQDVWQRRFTEAFFRNSGVPAGLLNITRAMTEQERRDTRQRFRDVYGGDNAWRIMVLDGGDVRYTPMGLPPGATEMGLTDLTRVAEARILGAFGIPASLIPTIVGLEGNRGQTASVSDRESFWQNTLVPLFRDLDATLSTGLADDFPDIYRLEHDLGKVKALQEDEDARHNRVREDWKAGLLTWRRAQVLLGEPEEPEEPGYVLVPTNMVPTWSDELLVEAEPEPLPEPGLAPTALPPPGPNGQQPVGAQNGQQNGAVRY